MKNTLTIPQVTYSLSGGFFLKAPILESLTPASQGKLGRINICLELQYLQEKLGELQVSLAYHPSDNTLTLGILKVCFGDNVQRFYLQFKARNLKAKDINGKSGDYF